MPASKYLHYKISRIYVIDRFSARSIAVLDTVPVTKYDVRYNELTRDDSSPVL